MHDIITELNGLARELLEGAKELSGTIDATEKGANVQTRLTESLRSICESLGKVHDLLSDPRGPLERLDRFVAGAEVADPLRRLNEFLKEHRRAFSVLGVSDTQIKSIEKYLEDTCNTGGTHDLTKSETLDVRDVLESVASLKELICTLSRAANIAELLTTPHLLRAAADGAVGTAIIVVDVTGAAAAIPYDFSMWTVVKAVKSVCTGGSMVKDSLGRLREAVKTLGLW